MRFELVPKPPFNFDLSAGIFFDDDPMIHKYEAGKFWKVIHINNKPILVTLSSSGTVNKPKLIVDLRGEQKISKLDQTEATKAINHVFNLDLDLNEFYCALTKDPIISKIEKRLHGFRCPNNLSFFESLVCSITEQQISMHVAFKIQGKITKLFGDSLNINGKTYFAFPTPEQLAAAELEDYRSCGLSQRKAEYIKGISQAIANKSLDISKFYNYKDTQDIINELCTFRGIGIWTVEISLIRSASRFDVIPAGDLGLRRWIAHYYFKDKPVTETQVRTLARFWGNWQGLVAYYFLILDQMSGYKDYKI